MNEGALAILVQGWMAPFVLAFCRVSGFMLMLPGMSSLRIPVRIRIVMALALSIAIAPLAQPGVAVTPSTLAAEVATGLVLATAPRFLFLAFAFAASAIATYAGIASMPGAPIESEEGHSPVAALITLTATAMIFASGAHGLFIAALAESQTVLPTGQWLSAERVLAAGADETARAFLLALRLSMPFLIYSIVVNLAIGLANKLSPQIPVYFISMPFVAAGGLLMLHELGADVLALFSTAVLDAARALAR